MTPNNLAKRYNWYKHSFLWVCGIFGLSLLTLGGFLRIQLAIIKKNNLKNLSVLNQVLPDFSERKLDKLRQEVKDLKIQLASLFNIFDPQAKQINKNYDLSIYFVEELNEINQSLRLKAQEKQVNSPDLGFKEKLPEEKEVVCLLSQLYAIKEVVSLGMDYGINFKSISPQPAEELVGLTGMRRAKTRIELTCAAERLVEFMIKLAESVPLVSIESILLNSKGSSFEISLILSNIVIDPQMWNTLKLSELTQDEQAASVFTAKAVSKAQESSISIIRSNNPFSVVKTKTDSSLEAKTPVEEPKLFTRFFYRGKGILKSQEMAVIEDSLNQEVIFAGLGQKINEHTLIKIEADRIILKEDRSGKEIIINRE